MSTFDPETLLQTATTDEFSTETSPIPEGEYNAIVCGNDGDEIQIREVELDAGPAWVMDIPLRIDAPHEPEANGRQVRWSQWLDLTPTGGLDHAPGKNIKLGQIRAACGQNQPGKPWKPADLRGSAIRIKVEHSTGKKDPSRVYANATMVAPV